MNLVEPHVVKDADARNSPQKLVAIGFRATLNFRKFKVALNLMYRINKIKSGYNDTSKSKSWNVLETVLSHLKI